MDTIMKDEAAHQQSLTRKVSAAHPIRLPWAPPHLTQVSSSLHTQGKTSVGLESSPTTGLS